MLIEDFYKLSEKEVQLFFTIFSFQRSSVTILHFAMKLLKLLELVIMPRLSELETIRLVHLWL